MQINRLKKIKSPSWQNREQALNIFKPSFAKATEGYGGAEGSRTPVQTYSPKAFYMLISSINCREITGSEQTNHFLS